jgi:transcription antitermination factor NusG
MHQEPPISFDGPQWFCVVVEPGCHREAEFWLTLAGYRTFFPKLKKWISHARVRKAVERPLLNRYMFVEVDHPRQSFGPVAAAKGVESIISLMGVPCVMPRAEVEDLLARYLAGEFDEVASEAIPIGARVCLVEGQFDNWLATVTGRGKGGRLTVKLLGKNVHLNKVSESSIRPASGFDLLRANPDAVISTETKSYAPSVT